MKLFVYGSLMHKFHHTRMPQHGLKYVKEDTVQGQLFDLHRFPGLVLGGDQHVHGEVFDITDPKVLCALDRYEGYVEGKPALSLYLRQKVKTSSGEEVFVYTYNMSLKDKQRVMSGDWHTHTNGRNLM